MGSKLWGLLKIEGNGIKGGKNKGERRVMISYDDGLNVCRGNKSRIIIKNRVVHEPNGPLVISIVDDRRVKIQEVLSSLSFIGEVFCEGNSLTFWENEDGVRFINKLNEICEGGR